MKSSNKHEDENPRKRQKATKGAKKVVKNKEEPVTNLRVNDRSNEVTTLADEILTI